MKQIISFGLTAALLLACLTGCGGQAGGTAPGGTASSGGQTPIAIPPSPSGRRIRTRRRIFGVTAENFKG